MSGSGAWEGRVGPQVSAGASAPQPSLTTSDALCRPHETRRRGVSAPSTSAGAKPTVRGVSGWEGERGGDVDVAHGERGSGQLSAAPGGGAAACSPGRGDAGSRR